VWSRNPYGYKGRHFGADAVAALPRPVQGPAGPPIWIGGNSARARRRAAEQQGWSPLIIDETVAKTTRTPALSTVEQFASAVAEVRELASAARGTDASLEVQVQTPQSRWSPEARSAEEHRDHLGRLAEAGATWFVIQPPNSSIDATVEGLERYGELLAGL
jgi:alkanesulfonate monooxygenase SsuD/methylene tetrahydromethanopterin reductase-like flavin-dependent oxidoreductase (luciferase family)